MKHDTIYFATLFFATLRDVSPKKMHCDCLYVIAYWLGLCLASLAWGVAAETAPFSLPTYTCI